MEIDPRNEAHLFGGGKRGCWMNAPQCGGGILNAGGMVLNADLRLPRLGFEWIEAYHPTYVTPPTPHVCIPLDR